MRVQSSNTILHYTADTGPIFSTRGPSVVTVHGVASRWISTARTWTQENIWRARVARAIKSTDRIITVSESSAHDVSAVFNLALEDIAVIPHGIDFQMFRAKTDLSDTLAHRLRDVEFALYIGNIEPRKNLDALIDAVEDEAALPCGMKLVIAGRPAWNFEETMRRIEHGKNVIYLGFVSDADRVALLQQCSIFVFPSLYEGFGFPVLEAMAAGAPVACSTRGSLKDLAGPARRFEELDSSGIARGLSEFIGDISWRARATIDGPKWAQRFDWSESVEKHTALYKELVSQ
ncbi:glycosyltransferase family 4 protein [Rhodococcus aetherivorans]|uniref:Glycosyltransferase family 4 protein n=1 Tax=Rhodococcus aetherivorans TaxID=191292 RepID=A0AA46SF86_9NOCA|nr:MULTISPECIES: glycosyltransferase family 1 protein [Rhodococcus]UYF95631.1 glycosyltransferase family 4 protein [Rhodococcus aetherivorans]